MIRFIHSADWQIGKQYFRVQDENKRFRLQQERIVMLGRIREAARSHAAEFIVVAGDFFDNTTPPSSMVLEVLEEIGAMEIPVLVIPGNHDHGAPGTVWHREDFQKHQPKLAPNLQLLLKREVVELERAIILPCPLLRNQDSEDPTLWLRSLDAASLPSDKPRIVLAHGGVHHFGGRDLEADPATQRAGNNVINLDALPSSDIDYVALGDWHNLKKVSERAWYPGTPEPDSFDKGENNERGQVLLVEVERGELPNVQPVSTMGKFRWHNMKFHFHGDPDLDRFEREVEERTGGTIGKHLLRVEVSGNLSLAGHQRYLRLMDELEDKLLRLRVKGECQHAPESDELRELTERVDDPLIARVASQLQFKLAAAEETDSEEAAVMREALSELYNLTAR